MKKALYFLLFFPFFINAQDTFSIVAVDPETGEVGSAGATCLDVIQEGASADIISDIFPGRGAIHTQSYYIPQNQINASNRMLAGDSPTEIMEWLQANDIEGNPAVRQYGAVDFSPEGLPRAAAFTGVECFSYKGQLVGGNYAIQGNILIGEEVLTGMEQGFLNTEGTLAKKLMAAMQGANIAGADSRCLDEGVSSRSAFLRVAEVGDTLGELSVDLLVRSTPFGVEPIDSLQAAYDLLFPTATTSLGVSPVLNVVTFPNPSAGDVHFSIQEAAAYDLSTIDFYTLNGEHLYFHTIESANFTIPKKHLGSNTIIFYSVKDAKGKLVTRGKIGLF